MKSAVSYARVSSKEQEQGYSLDAQVRTLSDYASSKDFRIVREFKYSESAKKQGRKHFNAMLDYRRSFQVATATKSKPRVHRFPFAGLLTCSHDNCGYTAELHKKKHIYYRCSFGKGRHKAPYIKESKVSELLGRVLKLIAIPANEARHIALSLRADHSRSVRNRQLGIHRVSGQLAGLQTRMRMAYRDKLDGTIGENFWKQNMKEWSGEETLLQEQLAHRFGTFQVATCQHWVTLCGIRPRHSYRETDFRYLLPRFIVGRDA